ncbi:hypothetical protein C5E06_01540 [Pseudoclavibacter sp. RFBI5]|uniref:hypothetical protein n=1 Tax=Pseudoclavibacter sp. RFBI5 TaxID=2080578 RepID=UPI000CE7B8DA|nr:hypothetical protein [Pseudoclavibacter sp. RFBI5]PPG05573.1 hypothetical protein C5E06_01540 [Pseudoclavibacter sp. RFBI5]
MTETTALRRSKTPLAAALAALALATLVGCAPTDPRVGNPSETPGADGGVYVEEFDLAVARAATQEEEELLRQEDNFRVEAAVLSEDRETFRVVRSDNGVDTCSEAPSRLMVLDSTTILITYAYLGDPEQACTLTGMTRVDEFQVPPGIDPEGVEVRMTSEYVQTDDPTVEIPSGATTEAVAPAFTTLDGAVAPVATAEQSALIPGTDITRRRPVVVANDDGTFTVIRPDGAEPCSHVPSELITLSASEVSINYRYLAKDGDGASCSVESIDRADVFGIPAGVAGNVSVSITHESSPLGPIIIEPATT